MVQTAQGWQGRERGTGNVCLVMREEGLPQGATVHKVFIEWGLRELSA